MQLVVLCEEPSAAQVVRALGPALAGDCDLVVAEHEGISDLRVSVPRKLKAWRRPDSRFIVMLDNDRGDCGAKKQAWLSLVPQSRVQHTKVRLVCQELEAWYLAEPEALREVGLIDDKKMSTLLNDRTLRNPDSVSEAKSIFRRHVDGHGQLELARRIGPHLRRDRNRSASFRAFCDAVTRLSAGG